MPISKYFHGHGSEVLKNMEQEYGEKKGKSVFYATANKRNETAKDASDPRDSKEYKKLYAQRSAIGSKLIAEGLGDVDLDELAKFKSPTVKKYFELDAKLRSLRNAGGKDVLPVGEDSAPKFAGKVPPERNWVPYWTTANMGTECTSCGRDIWVGDRIVKSGSTTLCKVCGVKAAGYAEDGSSRRGLSYDHPKIVAIRKKIQALEDKGVVYDDPRIARLEAEIRSLEGSAKDNMRAKDDLLPVPAGKEVKYMEAGNELLPVAVPGRDASYSPQDVSRIVNAYKKNNSMEDGRREYERTVRSLSLSSKQAVALNEEVYQALKRSGSAKDAKATDKWDRQAEKEYFALRKKYEAGGMSKLEAHEKAMKEVENSRAKDVRVNPAPIVKTVPISKAKHVKDVNFTVPKRPSPLPGPSYFPEKGGPRYEVAVGGQTKRVCKSARECVAAMKEIAAYHGAAYTVEARAIEPKTYNHTVLGSMKGKVGAKDVSAKPTAMSWPEWERMHPEKEVTPIRSSKPTAKSGPEWERKGKDSMNTYRWSMFFPNGKSSAPVCPRCGSTEVTKSNGFGPSAITSRLRCEECNEATASTHTTARDAAPPERHPVPYWTTANTAGDCSSCGRDIWVGDKVVKSGPTTLCKVCGHKMGHVAGELGKDAALLPIPV